MITKLTTVVVGLPYYDYEKIKEGIKVGMVLRLQYDKENKVSSTAVEVLTRDGKFKLGHIRKEDSEKILRNIPVNSHFLEARIIDISTRALTVEAYLYYENENKQTKENNMIDKLINTNKVVAGNAAYMEAGRIATNQLSKIASSKAPLMVRGYVDTPVGKVVIANLAAVVASQYRPNDAKLIKLTSAMMQNAYMELLRTLDVEGMINEFLEKTDVKAALDKVVEIQT